jgi:HEAT repeat protein
MGSPILTELPTESSAGILKNIATDARFAADEIRQAAVWGLGKAGLQRYAELVPFIGDADPDVCLHAIVAFGPDTSEAVIEELIGLLLSSDPQKAPAASEALRLIGTDLVLQRIG